MDGFAEYPLVPFSRFLRPQGLPGAIYQRLLFGAGESGVGVHRQIEPERHITLLHLSAFRRDAKQPGGWFGPIADVSRFLSRDTYTEAGQGWLTLVRALLLISLVALGRMFILMRGQL